MSILIECPSCKRKVSKDSKKCSGCSFKLSKIRTKTYYAEIYEHGKRVRIKKIGTSLKTAIGVLGKWEKEKVEGRLLDIKKDDRIFFKELAEKYLALDEAKRKRSYKRDVYCIKYLIEYFGNYKLSNITSSLIENYKTHRISLPSSRYPGKNFTHATVNRELALIKRIFNLFIKYQQ